MMCMYQLNFIPENAEQLCLDKVREPESKGASGASRTLGRHVPRAMYKC